MSCGPSRRRGCSGTSPSALWVGGDGCEAPFAIAGLAALLSPATALALTIGASEAAMARNARRFHLRLAGLVLAQLLSA